MGLKLVRRDGVWRIEGRVLGERVRKSTGFPDTAAYKAMAEKMRLQIEKDIIEGSGRPKGPGAVVTFGQAAEGYMAWQKVERRLSKALERSVGRWLKDWESVRLDEITPAAIQSYVQATMAGLKPGTVRRNLTDFRSVLNWAKDNAGFKGLKVPMPRVNDARDQHFDEEQAVAFLTWVRVNEPELFGHFLTMIDTGVRMGELMNIRAAHFGDGVLRVRRVIGRTGKTIARDVPLTADMEVLAREIVRTKGPQEPVFGIDGRTGRKWDALLASKELCKVLREGCKAIGLPYQGDEAMRCHDLRHTFAYLTAKAGADLGDLQYLLGHSDINMTMRYRGFIQSRARTYVGRARRVLDVNGQKSGHA